MNTEIGNTVWTQMNTIDRNLVWCMGTKNPTAIENGLRFQVNGLSFKGTVEITLNGKDLYDVKFLKCVRKQNPEMKALGLKVMDTVLTLQSEVNDVYAEDLMPLLESKVENRKAQ
jgi:hypothetical protein